MFVYIQKYCKPLCDYQHTNISISTHRLEFFMEEHNLGKCKTLLNYLVFCITWNRFKCGMSELCNTRISFKNIWLCIYHFCWEWNRIMVTEKHFIEDTADVILSNAGDWLKVDMKFMKKL